MAATHLIAARVSPETKAKFRALAERQQMTESVLLKQLVDSVSFAGVVSGLFTSWLGVRLGRTIPVVVGALGLLVAMIMRSRSYRVSTQQ